MLPLLLLIACSGGPDHTGTAPVTTALGCEDPAAIAGAAGSTTGLVRCADGALNRVGPPTDAPGVPGGSPCPGSTPSYGSCETDADCTTQDHGGCRFFPGEPTDGTCACVYACTDDSGCPAAEACAYVGALGDAETGGACLDAGCRSGADCASGECGASFPEGFGFGDSQVGFFCRSAADTCHSDAECVAGKGCFVAPEGHFECRAPNTAY